MKFTRSKPLVHFHNGHAQTGFLDRIFVGNKRERPDFNRRMFDEDFSMIFHYSNRHGGDLFQLTTNNEDLTERLFANVHTQYGPHNLDETIREWTEEIANSLIWAGKAFYHLRDDPETDDVHICSFGPSGVSTVFGLTFQWLPRRTERHWDRDDEENPREIRFLDSRKLLRFKMPKVLRRMLFSQNKTLAVLDRHQHGTTNLHPQATHENPNPTNYFDFNVWRDAQDLALYRSTRVTGWNGRKHDGSKRSDFFDCHRLIRFRRNQLILRDDILKQLGFELTRVGKQFSAEYDVKVKANEQLPSVEQLDELEARLSGENAAFSEIIDFCYKT